MWLGRRESCSWAVRAEFQAAAGADRRLDAYVGSLEADLGVGWTDVDEAEAQARRLVERLVLALQGSLLVRHGHPAVADAFCASRLAGDGGRAFGTLPVKADVGSIVERARP
jgi:putative acyl-CoA dehydrogenase